MTEITRSPGLLVSIGAASGIVGGGGRGLTDELDGLVTEAAARLAAMFDMDVTIRFNSDRRSGKAWLKTHDVDGIGANAEVGVGGAIVSCTYTDDGKRVDIEPYLVVQAMVKAEHLIDPSLVNSRGGSRPYYLDNFASLDDALTSIANATSREHLVND